MSEEEAVQHTVIGTRGSDLALVQAAAVERTLSLAFPELRMAGPMAEAKQRVLAAVQAAMPGNGN